MNWMLGWLNSLPREKGTIMRPPNLRKANAPVSRGVEGNTKESECKAYRFPSRRKCKTEKIMNAEVMLSLAKKSADAYHESYFIRMASKFLSGE
jgi:hypothetical protein